MNELIERLKAALDDDERIALAAEDDRWRVWEARWADRDYVEYEPLVGYPEELGTVAANLRAEHAVHIARHDPARVLRQVAAHRKILELHECSKWRQIDGAEHHYCLECGSKRSVEWPCQTVLALAAAYGIE